MTVTTVGAPVQPSTTSPHRAHRARRDTFRTRMTRRAPLLPALIFTIVVTQLPFLYTVYISFLGWDRDHPEFGKNWVGLKNFRAVFSDQSLRSAVLVTIE